MFPGVNTLTNPRAKQESGATAHRENQNSGEASDGPRWRSRISPSAARQWTNSLVAPAGSGDARLAYRARNVTHSCAIGLDSGAPELFPNLLHGGVGNRQSGQGRELLVG